MIVNAADLLARWSNDVLRSTMHRVVAPPGSDAEDVTPQRQSVAFFCRPNLDAEISCIPACVAPGQKPKYETISTAEYIVMRVGTNVM